MAYNKAREEKKWRLWKEAEEKQLRKLGVDESTIETLRTHDWAIFNSDRRYYQRMQEAGTYLEGIADDTQQPEIKTMGTLISPHYLTASFPKLLEKNNLRHIRFHDLRHSCASLLLANGVPMKQIQEWLGHSDFSTTANVYAHLDYNSKLSSADAMVNGLSGALEVIS